MLKLHVSRVIWYTTCNACLQVVEYSAKVTKHEEELQNLAGIREECEKHLADNEGMRKVIVMTQYKHRLYIVLYAWEQTVDLHESKVSIVIKGYRGIHQEQEAEMKRLQSLLEVSSAAEKTLREELDEARTSVTKLQEEQEQYNATVSKFS